MSSLLEYMQAFEGEPYGIEWATDERVSHLPMTNDITQPGALPIVDLEVNGQTVSLILDTGGDRLYLDKDIYASLGLTTLANREATLRLHRRRRPSKSRSESPKRSPWATSPSQTCPSSARPGRSSARPATESSPPRFSNSS